MPERAYIALGSNRGGRGETLRKAIDMLRQTPGVTLRRVSGFIETPAVTHSDELGIQADESQPDYLNGVVEVDTSLPPHDLLDCLHDIENALGRQRHHEQRWGPRTCDLDILLYGQESIDEPDLTIPHPRLAERRFVLEPLVEIAPEARHPDTYETAAEMLAKLNEQD
ncbi:MAG: 2-amino-4-hydroxy-6-hydroxymethyldihydropteridine diphosphokinase [Planctomycetes bacterium]|jgi:2-amino-4-hydroxy-6-hydroxymethyldihydropteridine diphosphokinase|nr:2-amino-4-hydroxy-6-hydroxymethyldihydropteridine diphosphokinase [Planctomycetota bacterium]